MCSNRIEHICLHDLLGNSTTPTNQPTNQPKHTQVQPMQPSIQPTKEPIKPMQLQGGPRHQF